MNYLEPVALYFVYFLAICATVLIILNLFFYSMEKIVRFARVSKYVLAYFYDKEGFLKARTIIEQEEEIERITDERQALIDFWEGKYNRLLVSVSKIMPTGLDCSTYSSKQLDEAILDRCEELNVSPNQHQTLVNFRSRDWKLIEYAGFCETSDKIEPSMDKIEKFNNMSFLLNENGRPVKENGEDY